MYPGQQRRAGGPGSRPSSANPRGISAVGSRISSFHPSNTGASGTSVASPPRNSGSMQDALVTNLKQQVACFETEVKYLKEKLNTREEDRRGGGGEASSRPLTGRSMGSISQLSGGSNELLARRAQELEEEVDTLRMRYAEREQQHALEVAAIRAGEGVSGLSAVHGAAGKFKNEMERREHQSKNEMSSMRDLHAQEVVMLQKTVERLQRELQYATGGNSSNNTSACGDNMPATTRKTLAEELVAFKDQLRAMTDENICLKRQHEDMISALANEQQQRRALEASNTTLKKENEALGGEVKSKLESKIEGLEAKAKQAHASEVTKHYEMERARAAETKLKDDLDSAIRDKLDAEEKMNKAIEEKAVVDAKLASVQETLTDATGERDYYRLQHDRLLTEHKLAETKIKQLESKVDADRHSIQLLEKQYCGTLDEIDSMRRQHVAKEDSYRDLDNNDNATRRENYILKQDCERLRQKLNLLEEDNQFMQRRYDSVRHLADQSAAEGQIRSALGRLGKTKEELQNLLQTQMRLANELSSAMCDIPDLATVAGAIHHSDMSHDGNSSSAAVVEQNRDAISKIREELNKVTSKIKAEEVRLAPLLSSATLEPSPSAALYPPMPAQSPKADEPKILGTPPNNEPLSLPPVQQQQQQQPPVPVAANLAPSNSFYGHYPPTYTPGYLSNAPQQQQQPNYAPPSYPLYSSALPPQQQHQQQLQQPSPVAVDPTQEVPSSRPATASEARVYSSVNGA